MGGWEKTLQNRGQYIIHTVIYRQASKVCHKCINYFAMQDFTVTETFRVTLAARTLRLLLYQEHQVNVSRTCTAICFLH